MRTPRSVFTGVALLLALACAAPASSSAAALPSGFAGMVSEDALAGSPAYRDQQLAAMAASGVTLLRQTIDWAQVETSPGRYTFAAYDAFVADAARHGIEVMPVLFNTPSFRSARPAHSRARGTYPPADAGQFALFAGQAVAHYGPDGTFWASNPTVPRRPIRRWQVWNEPNLKAYWLPKPNAARYVSLLRITSRKIHRLDPRAEVIAAGLPQSRSGTPLLDYLKQMLRAGAGRWMDTVGVNPYATTARGTVRLLQSVRKVLDARGRKKIALRATELGWSDRGPHSPFRLGAKGQASQIGKVVAALAANRRNLKLRGFSYFNWRDAVPYPGGKDFWGLHTGLLRLDGSSKPALASFRKALKLAR